MRSKPRKPRPRDLLVQGLMVSEARARGKSFLGGVLRRSDLAPASLSSRFLSHTTKSEASIKFI